MNNLFVITITTKENHFKTKDRIFSDTGDFIGIVLNARKCDLNLSNTCFSYDVETVPKVYDSLKDGTIRISGIEKYTVELCNMSYTSN
ncbi:hypothetical protein [uncultured Ruminococcus sp.]|uniref:hypothetical protein n=1 Tax=uncultured Ruminococcus sp. TaxID=165186 RepID=UPI0025FEF433|nr:hypothetical protein [uncultured Ruminococcus sp.]